MKNISISKYPYSHGMFRTSEYYEVYVCDNNDPRGGKAIALFDDYARALAYQNMLENEEA